jgi:DNA-binding IclR family transcriptional regulator
MRITFGWAPLLPRRREELMTNPDLQAMILKRFEPGFCRYSRDIVDECYPYSKSAVRRALTDMRRQGVIGYAEGYGYWSLPLKVADRAEGATPQP